MTTEKKDIAMKTIVIWSVTAGVILAVVIGGATFAAAGYGSLYEGKIFPGVRVLNVRLDGLNAEEARTTLNHAVDAALKEGLRFRYVPGKKEEKSGGAGSGTAGPKDVTLAATTVATNDPDASRELVSYDIEPAVVAALSYGRSKSLLIDTFVRWKAWVSPVHLDAGVELDREQITRSLIEATGSLLPTVQDATLNVSWDAALRKPLMTITPEREGRELNIEPVLRTLQQQAERLRFEPITIQDHIVMPHVRVNDVERAKGDIPTLLSHAPFRFNYDGKDFNVTTSTFATWLGVSKAGGTPVATIDPEKFAKGLRALAPQVEKAAKQGSLVFEDGKLKSFIPGTEGITIEDAAQRTLLLQTWAGGTSSTFPLLVKRTEPSLSGSDPEKLGIKEIIGIGRSNFSGSPTNRRKNIANGIKKINGTVIKPGEEFSLLNTLGPIEDGQGWLPELVIKGNETVPELGGGLCQIGTTAFRAALASGLPITQRRNHSYRVRYYEPAGTDATIYEPSPDFKFKNDMNSHVIIHAYAEGDDLIYEFWGTRDGRTTLFKGSTETTSVDALKPRVFNVVPPPEKKIIETLELPPGKTKCTESAHAGAAAEFTYIVNYSNGTTQENVFRSHYRPWQAVCLVGVEKLSEPVTPVDPNTTPTEAVDTAAVN